VLLAATGRKLLPAASVATCIEPVMVPSASPERSTVAVPLVVTVVEVLPPFESVKVTTALSSDSRPLTLKCTSFDCAVRIVVSTNDSASAACSPLS
jgi:hypothetical protein